MACRQSAAQNLPKFMFGWRMKVDIVTVFSISSYRKTFLQNFVTRGIRIKSVRRGGGTRTSSIFRERDPVPADWSNAIRKRWLQDQGQGMRSRERRMNVKLIGYFLLLYHCIFVIDYINIFAVTVMNKLATSLKKIIEWYRGEYSSKS